LIKLVERCQRTFCQIASARVGLPLRDRRFGNETLKGWSLEHGPHLGLQRSSQEDSFWDWASRMWKNMARTLPIAVNCCSRVKNAEDGSAAIADARRSYSYRRTCGWYGQGVAALLARRVSLGAGSDIGGRWRRPRRKKRSLLEEVSACAPGATGSGGAVRFRQQLSAIWPGLLTASRVGHGPLGKMRDDHLCDRLESQQDG
jgi:hypothetical protein